MNVLNPFSKLRRPRTIFDSRYSGAEDEYGFDLKTFYTCEPFFRFLYEEYFQVKVCGIENIPANGRAILVGNHSGGLPIDAFMLLCAILDKHPAPRRVRALALDWLRRTPILGKVIRGMGAVPARLSVAVKLLENDELVCIYPEGARGVSKPYAMRYRLEGFNPGFIEAAILTKSPIIPVATVGGDELYPLLTKVDGLAKLVDMPFFPLTTGFPWLPITSSCIPMPVKMFIKVGKPIYLDYPEEEAHNKQLRMQLAHEVQFKIQSQLNCLLRKRKSSFAGWDAEDLKK